jgi:3-oxoacyl-[acyl-carrier protein] reductase
MTTQPLTEKVAIVTGASRGIGRSIALLLASKGAKVVVNYSSNPESAEKVVQEIEQDGGQAIAIHADISKVSEVGSLFKQAIESFGKVDILVNNAGVMTTKPIEQITEEDFDRQFAINVKGTYFACQQAAKLMGEGGRIINFSTSVAGAMFPAYSLYAGTKGAVEQFTRHLAKELGPKGITINAVAPGPIQTELFTVGKTEAQIKQLGSMNSFNRLGEPEDISAVIAFLVSEESRWISGQTIRINGGFI